MAKKIHSRISPNRRRRRQFALQRLERRELLSAVAVHSALTDGGTNLNVSYELTSQASPFNLAVYRSTDSILGGDTLLRSISITAPADLTPGLHTKTIALGGATSQLPLPGINSNDAAGDYYLLAAADLVDAAMADNLAPISGVYHAPTRDVLVQGGAASDSLAIDAAHQVNFNGAAYSYVAADVKTYRVRGHGGNDVLNGSTATKSLWMHGGEGDDILAAGSSVDSLFGGDGNDVLTGGGGNDQLDGGAGSDSYIILGTGDGADRYADTGTTGTDQIVAGAAGALIRFGQRFVGSETGIEVITASGLANVTAVASSGNDVLNFTGVSLQGLTVIDASTGDDQVTGSAGDDTIKGHVGNDTIQGGPGRDVALFAGNRAAYSVVTTGGVTVITDLHPTTHGNDGADTLTEVEVARFRDGDVALATAPNAPPVAWTDFITASEDGGTITAQVLANDTDADLGDVLRVIAVDGSGTPGWMELIIIYGVGVGIWHPGTPAIQGTASVAPDGRGVLYTPASAFQSLGAGQSISETIVYTIADAAGAAASAPLNVLVQGANDAPLAIADQLTLAGNAAPQTINVLANDFDVDNGDTKTVASLDTTGLLGAVSIAPGGAGVIYSPGAAFAALAAGQSATDAFRYTVVDRAGAASTAEVRITLTGANTAPEAVPDAAAAVENGAPITIHVLANDNDADVGDTRRVVAVSAAGLQGNVTIAADGASLTYAVGNAFQHLRAGATATETFTYTMTDRGGAQSTAVVTVTVTGINDAPQAVANTASVSEDAAPLTIDVLANDNDVDQGDTKTVIGVTATGLRGAVSVTPGGQGVVYSVGSGFQYLRAGQTAAETFTYTMVDGAGVQSTASVSVSISGANDGPTANPDAVTITEDTGSLSVAVLNNDTDPDTGDTRRVQSVNAAGLLGRVTVNTGGNGLTYAPGTAFQYLQAGQTAVETFSYTMVDGAGAQSTATVTVNITGATDGPIAMPDAATAAEDAGPIVIPALANDINDLNPGAAQTIVSIDGAGSPATIEMIIIYGVGVGFINPGFPAMRGSAEIASDGRQIIYTPHQGLRSGQFETDLFKYTITDGSGRHSTAIVSVLVTGADDAPTAAPDALTLPYNAGPTTISVLANDSDPDDGDTKTVVSVDGSGLMGSASLAPGGAGVIYSPGAAFASLAYGQSATETFSYTMADAAGRQSTAAVTVTITGVNRPPVTMPDVATAYEDGAAVTIHVLANDGDPDAPAGDVVTLTSVNGAGVQGSLSMSGSSVVYEIGAAFQHLAAGATETETFTYLVSDALGLTATGQATITVHGANDRPTAVNNAVSISEDAGPYSMNVLDNDVDVDLGDTMRVVSVNAAGLQGSVAIEPGGGGVIYTVGAAFQALNNGQTATETFNYTMADGAGATSTATATITIVGANEPVIYINPPTPGPGAIVGTSGDDVMNSSAAAETLFGENGDDEIYGNGGADTIYGGAGDDQLEGGDGNDVLSGGSGRDDLTGDAGADLFRYYLASESTPASFDRIRDFDSAEGDKIDLNLIDASTLVGGNNDFVWANSFTLVAGQLVVQAVPGSGAFMVRGDVNGDGVADLEFEVRSPRALTAADFLL